MNPLNKPHKLAISITLILILTPLLYLIQNLNQYLIIMPGVGISDIIWASFIESFIGLQIFAFNPLPVILRILLIPIAWFLLFANWIVALIFIIFLTIYLMFYIFINTNSIYTNSHLNFLWPFAMIVFSMGISFLSLFPIAWISLTGYQNLGDLSKKLIIPCLILFLLIIPGETIVKNLKHINTKAEVGSLKRPTNLPDNFEGAGPERSSGDELVWWYNCWLDERKILSGSFVVTQLKLGEIDTYSKEPVSLESQKKAYFSNYIPARGTFKDIKVKNQPGFIFSSSNDYYLFWSTPKNVVKIWTQCPNINERKLLQIAETM